VARSTCWTANVVLGVPVEWHVVFTKSVAQNDICKKASLALDGFWQRIHHRQGGLKDALF
jgi:hypothetical protein